MPAIYPRLLADLLLIQYYRLRLVAKRRVVLVSLFNRRLYCMSNKIFVGNLAYSASEADLEAAFGDYGPIHEVKIVMDRETKKSRGFGFITFESPEAAKRAHEMDGKELKERPLRVNAARSKDFQEERY
jgi:cold-inducible RNA-binding protein